ncbi:MAG: Asp-tRNA(Asn)/Glu-tRNA(Gln) amidotransferase subunit GatB, partial [Acidilobaceae archaeon]
GALPVVNKRVVELALRAALATNCRIPQKIVFTRKHYFYPDLPKSYQISMFEKAGGVPMCLGGHLDYLDPVTWTWKRCRIKRINIEEDPGRTTYEEDITRSPLSYVDYNRSGVPLLEIVTEPDLESPKDARAFIEYLLLTLEHLGVTNPRLEGAFRVDANVSVADGERVEVKNIGSIADVEKALMFEIMRQTKILESGGSVSRETRHWDSARGITISLRHKEYEEEYLYFPDPDLPPILLTPEMVKDAEREVETKSVAVLLSKLLNLGVSKDLAWSLVQVKSSLKVFLEAVEGGADPLLTAKMLAVDYKGELKELEKDVYDPSSWPPARSILKLTEMVKKGEYPYDTIKGLVLPKLARNPLAPIEELLPEKIVDIEVFVEETLKAEKKAVADYLSGKREALNYLVGATIKRIGKKAVDPRAVREVIEKKLKEWGQTS